jgi:multiple antibiotic resistance protein
VELTWTNFLDNALLFFVLINPASKVALLVALREEHTTRDLDVAAWRGSVVALVLLVAFAWTGSWVLSYVFHVELYALDVAAGAVLFLVGLGALKQGRFFEVTRHEALRELSIVPLASPLIAGPATISAAITQSARCGSLLVSGAIGLAIATNLLVMFIGIKLANPLVRLNVIGPMVRILGLFVAAIGANILLKGIGIWLTSLSL